MIKKHTKTLLTLYKSFLLFSMFRSQQMKNFYDN